MRPSAEQLAQELADTSLTAPSIPVTGNADVRTYEDAQQIREGLAKQLYSPVRWTETVLFLAAQDVSGIVECGPGKVLAGLNRRIEKSMNVVAVQDPAGLAAAVTAVQEGK